MTTFGIIGLVLTLWGNTAQLLKTLKTKTTEDLSLTYVGTLNLIFVCFAVHSIMMKDLVLSINYILCIIMWAIILFYKIKGTINVKKIES